ncbi:hypothetical protein SLNSH_08275 [Alsobacter soli]|uniref:DUF3617 domain-containing protein n=1 Tax=Alsobacter soli TaxID=2109933 RepID=A0A2T1HVE8_9HYPH|nr:hypothetical protein [Alsobacter soli]PSC05570.1 hypothetical protein SLNSH_08275 [Alsobacter soli]
MKMMVTAAVAALGFLAPAAAFAQKAPAISGAYVGPGQGCEEVFVFRKGKASFKEPRNAFGSAFLVQGGSLRTAMASCRIGRRSSDPNGVTTLDLNCTNTMSSSGMKAYFRAREDGSLMRLSGPNETSGDSYHQCAP